jgi:hypothetical protein
MVPLTCNFQVTQRCVGCCDNHLRAIYEEYAPHIRSSAALLTECTPRYLIFVAQCSVE